MVGFLVMLVVMLVCAVAVLFFQVSDLRETLKDRNTELVKILDNLGTELQDALADDFNEIEERVKALTTVDVPVITSKDRAEEEATTGIPIAQALEVICRHLNIELRYHRLEELAVQLPAVGGSSKKKAA